MGERCEGEYVDSGVSGERFWVMVFYRIVGFGDVEGE